MPSGQLLSFMECVEPAEPVKSCTSTSLTCKVLQRLDRTVRKCQSWMIGQLCQTGSQSHLITTSLNPPGFSLNYFLLTPILYIESFFRQCTGYTGWSFMLQLYTVRVTTQEATLLEQVEDSPDFYGTATLNPHQHVRDGGSGYVEQMFSRE